MLERGQHIPSIIYPIPSAFRRALIDISVISRYLFAMSISSKVKRLYRQSRPDLSQEQHTPEPERNSNSNSYNTSTSSISNSHNYSPANFFLFPYGNVNFFALYQISLEFYLIVDHEETEPLAGPIIRPFLKVASRLQSRIKVPEADAETEDSPSDSDKIPPISKAPPPQSRSRRIIVGDNCQSKTLRPEYISAKRRGKQRRTEDPKPEPENDDRTQKETDGFAYFLYILAFCALIFFLIFLFLLFVIFLFWLYVLYLFCK